jgi:HPt (histidine-containing phosphotransfer) domain-containing protein
MQAKMTEAVGAGNLQDLGRHAHTVKGMAGNLGAVALQNASTALEAAVKQGDLPAILSCLDAYEQTWRELDAALACLEAGDAGKAQKAAQLFRQSGISCEVFLEPKKLTQQFILAEKKGIPWMIVPQNNYSRFTLRNIALRENKEDLCLEDALKVIAGDSNNEHA